MESVTNALRIDGFGSQFQKILSTILFAETTGKCFKYTDIQQMGLITYHGTIKDTEDENTLEEVVNYMGVKYRYPPADDKSVAVESYHYLDANIDPVCESEAFRRFKHHFYDGKINRFDTQYFNVAVHIRRAGHFDMENGFFRPGSHDILNLEYLAIMCRIEDEHPGRNIKFHIYSQGKLDDFTELISDNVVFHLNEKVLDTFTDMIFADVLVVTRSSFSYTAGLLSNNTVYYIPLCHSPRSHWIQAM